MRKLIIIGTIATCFFVSCNSGGPSAKAKKNLEVNTAIMKAYEAGEFDKVKEYIAADAVDHGGEMGDVKGVDSIIAQMKYYHGMMTDTKSEVIHELADDDYVMTWGKFSGTLTKDGMGMKAGDKMNMTSIDLTKFADGKAVEHWVFMDGAEMNKMMMGMMQQMQRGAPSPDTTKNKVAE